MAGDGQELGYQRFIFKMSKWSNIFVYELRLDINIISQQYWNQIIDFVWNIIIGKKPRIFY